MEDERLAAIDKELNKIQGLLKEYHSWKDPKTQKVSFPPGRYFDFKKMVEREYQLIDERKSAIDSLLTQ